MFCGSRVKSYFMSPALYCIEFRGFSSFSFRSSNLRSAATCTLKQPTKKDSSKKKLHNLYRWYRKQTNVTVGRQPPRGCHLKVKTVRFVLGAPVWPPNMTFAFVDDFSFGDHEVTNSKLQYYEISGGFPKHHQIPT